MYLNLLQNSVLLFSPFFVVYLVYILFGIGFSFLSTKYSYLSSRILNLVSSMKFSKKVVFQYYIIEKYGFILWLVCVFVCLFVCVRACVCACGTKIINDFIFSTVAFRITLCYKTSILKVGMSAFRSMQSTFFFFLLIYNLITLHLF